MLCPIIFIWLRFKAKLAVLSGIYCAFLCYYSSPKRELSFIPINMSFGKIFTNTFSSSCQKQMDHSLRLRLSYQIKMEPVGGNLWKNRMAEKAVAHLFPSLETQFITFTQHLLSKLAKVLGAWSLFSNKCLLKCHCNILGVKAFLWKAHIDPLLPGNHISILIKAIQDQLLPAHPGLSRIL